jgi:cell division septation protein DedD
MNKNIVPGLTVGAILIVLLLLLYFFYYRGAPQQTVPAPGPPSGPSAAVTPAVKPPPTTPAPQELVPQKPPAAPGSELTPPGPKVTVLPPQKAKEQYGLLVGKYRRYRNAGKMLARLKKRGIPGFIRRKEPKRGPYEVWAGPFSSRREAEAAEKSIRAMLKRTPTIHKIETPVPK